MEKQRLLMLKAVQAALPPAGSEADPHSYFCPIMGKTSGHECPQQTTEPGPASQLWFKNKGSSSVCRKQSQKWIVMGDVLLGDITRPSAGHDGDRVM